MVKPESLILVAMLDKDDIKTRFKRKRLDWPMHITLVPWFEVPSRTVLQKLIAEKAAQLATSVAVIGEDALFGPDNDIPVSLVVDDGHISNLHNALLDVVNQQGANHGHDGSWVGENYRPHVTHHADHRLHPGEVIPIDNVTLVQLNEDDICEVISVQPIGNRVVDGSS